jgi:hypothetical protein
VISTVAALRMIVPARGLRKSSENRRFATFESVASVAMTATMRTYVAERLPTVNE